MKKLLLISVILALIAGLILSGCTSTPSSPAAPSGPSTSAPSVPPPGAPSGPPPGAPSASQPTAKTLKIGIVSWFGSGSTLDWINAVKLQVELDNKNGGVTIGGDKYMIQTIEYDNNNNQNTEVAAINKLVYQDGVKYIIAQGLFESAWLSVTEKEKVIVMNSNNNYNISNLPMYKYSFNGCGTNLAMSAVTGWFVKNFPEQVKTLAIAAPDNQMGHLFTDMFGGTWKAFGVNPTNMYFPSSQQDLSALGTKVATMNPGLFMALGGGATADGLIINAVVQAGYKGQIINATQSPLLSLKAALSPQALEGFMCGAVVFDFDPPPVQSAVDFKNAWIAKYGKWEGPEVVFEENYDCLKAAWAQAGSLDADKMAAVLSSGMKYDGVAGPMQMVSRPDLGNDRTTDSVQTYYVKRIHNGVAELAATISMEEAIDYMHLAFPPLPPGATPPGLPPPGGPGPGGPPPGGPPPG